MALALTVAEPNKTAAGWDVSAVALFTDNRKNPIQGKMIQFYLDFRPYDAPVETLDDGRAPIVFSSSVSGKHTFEAQEVGTAVKSAPQTKEFKDAAQAACTLTYEPCGSAATGYFVLFTLRDKGQPAVRKQIIITDLTTGHKSIKITLGDGTVRWDVPDFPETQRDFKAVSLNPYAECEFTFFRPEPD